MRISTNKFLTIIQLFFILAALSIQVAFCDCAQRGGNCGGNPYIDCCNNEDVCKSIYDDSEITLPENEGDEREIGECKAKE